MNSGPWGVQSLKMMIVDRSGNIVETVDGWGTSYDRTRFTNILKSFVNGDGVTKRPIIVSTTTQPIVLGPSKPRKDVVRVSVQLKV